MNNFTKNELIEIYRAILWYINAKPPYVSSLRGETKHKVRSLIDNYCDHIDFTTYPFASIDVCDQCHRIIS